MLVDKALLDDLDRGLPGGNPPDVLWHYTSAASAKAILENRSIHLACHAFMNDPAEGTIAGTIVSECWASILKSSPPHPSVDFSRLRDLRRTLSYFDYARPELPPTFLFSVTELRDSLSQWSRYGDNGAGVALGFVVDPAQLPSEANRPWITGTQLVQVDYGGSQAKSHSSRLRPLINDLLAKYLPLFKSDTEAENTLIELIHRLSPIVKCGSYSEEREWRLITRTVMDSDEHYEIGCNRFGFVPYVPLRFEGGIRLVELVLGPKLARENIWSAKWLCKKFGHEPSVTPSTLAYR